MTEASAPALRLDHVSVEYRVKGQNLRVLKDVSFAIAPGESYGLVGESGCGKSTAAYAVLRYLPRNGRIAEGRILVDGHDLYNLPGAELRELRRKSVAMVYQDPGKALNPSIKVGRQVAEVFELAGVARSEWSARVRDILRKVRISDPERVMERYPHQLSGGMQQRVAIAMALASDPSLLILDEPTTGLDATVEADVLDLILQLRKEFATSILFISHNLAVIAKMCDRVGVLYAGELVEEGPAREVFRSPRHPYTAGLLRCLPQRGRNKQEAPLATIPGFLPALGELTLGCIFAARCDMAEERCRTEQPKFADLGGRSAKCHFTDRLAVRAVAATEAAAQVERRRGRPVLDIKALSKTFGRSGHPVKAVSRVSLSLAAGETLGLVGESGSGKTTLAKSILGLIDADPGSVIEIEGKEAAHLLAKRPIEQVKALQIVFQNPDSALNRSHSVRRMIARTIERLTKMPRDKQEERIQFLARSVRLSERYLASKPRQLSGGMKQRVAIARAFAGDPNIVICDEPTSALDVSVQAAILNLLVELQQREQVSYIFISHDLGVVRYISDRIAVLYLGQLMEVGPAEEVFQGPHHPYTAALLSAVPSLDGEEQERLKLEGEIPSAAKLPVGCPFHTRCQMKIGAICENERPPERVLGGAGHVVNCHLPVERFPKASDRVSGKRKAPVV